MLQTAVGLHSLKRALHCLRVEHMDVSETYRNQQFDCVAELWQQCKSAKSIFVQVMS